MLASAAEHGVGHQVERGGGNEAISLEQEKEHA
jgi:hypothetical protein